MAKDKTEERNKKIDHCVAQLTGTFNKIMNLWTDKTLAALKGQGFSDAEIRDILARVVHAAKMN